MINKPRNNKTQALGETGCSNDEQTFEADMNQKFQNANQ